MTTSHPYAFDMRLTRIWVNPSRTAVRSLLHRYGKLRLTASDGDTYFWYAWDATHDQITKELGLVPSDSRYQNLDEGDDVDMLFAILNFKVRSTHADVARPIAEGG